jgi:hypothetical protein
MVQQHGLITAWQVMRLEHATRYSMKKVIRDHGIECDYAEGIDSFKLFEREGDYNANVGFANLIKAPLAACGLSLMLPAELRQQIRLRPGCPDMYAIKLSQRTDTLWFVGF